METWTTPRGLYVAGQRVEVWENPDFPFRCSDEQLESWADNDRWDLLFNALADACFVTHHALMPNPDCVAVDDEP